MATVIPSLSSIRSSNVTAGERLFSERLEALLEDDYLCWYNVPIHGKRHMRYPDFLVLNPRRGLLALEVKDWKLETIAAFDKTTFTLQLSQGEVKKSNPLAQARQCITLLLDRLQRDPQLVQVGGKHGGNLILPWGFGVVLTGITRKQFDTTELSIVLPSHLVICKDEMLASTDAADFQQALWTMFPYTFPCLLSLPQIDRVRWHIYPEVRIGNSQFEFNVDVDSAESAQVELPDVLKVMDSQQEQLARSLGEGHRIIHGVAGSGKTLILGYRAAFLADTLEKPILVLCFNKTLASKLQSVMWKKGLSGRVKVHHFHGWCGEQIRLYHVDAALNDGPRYEEMVERVIDAVDRGQIPRAQYGAVMIDEGHDFKPEWFKLVVQMIDPSSQSLLLLYDDAQSIYRSQGKKKFSFASVGVQARGRTTILKMNYRNTREVLEFAYEFARDALTPLEADEDDVPLVAPQSAGRHGPRPLLLKFPNQQDEFSYLVEQVGKLHREGVAWKDIALLCHTKSLIVKLGMVFAKQGYPTTCVNTGNAKSNLDLDSDSIKIITIESSKGLEFPVVIMPAVGEARPRNMSTSAEIKLLYVGMTRAMTKLIISGRNATPMMVQLNHAYQNSSSSSISIQS
ncbi:MAG: 3'-5' exonuclease [Herbaspirillum sp.]